MYMAQSITISDVACVNLRGFCVSTRLTNRVHGFVLTIYFLDAQEMCTRHCANPRRGFHVLNVTMC